MFARAQSRYHPTHDDRADELPERSLDDDRDHVYNRHGDILRGHCAGKIPRDPVQSHGMQLGPGNIQDVYRSAYQQDIHRRQSANTDHVLFDFHPRHLERVPGEYQFILSKNIVDKQPANIIMIGFDGDVLEHSDALSRHQHVQGSENVEFADPHVQHKFQTDIDRGSKLEIACIPGGKVGQRRGHPQFGRPLRRVSARKRFQLETFPRRSVRSQQKKQARAAHDGRVSDIVLYIVRGP